MSCKYGPSYRNVSNTFSDALASLALMIVTGSLTDLPKLEIVNFSHLAVLPPRLSVSLVTLVSLFTPISLVIPVCVVTPVAIGIICTLQEFQFHPAHLWTDVQSCLFLIVYYIGCSVELASSRNCRKCRRIGRP